MSGLSTILKALGKKAPAKINTAIFDAPMAKPNIPAVASPKLRFPIESGTTTGKGMASSFPFAFHAAPKHMSDQLLISQKVNETPITSLSSGVETQPVVTWRKDNAFFNVLGNPASDEVLGADVSLNLGRIADDLISGKPLFTLRDKFPIALQRDIKEIADWKIKIGDEALNLEQLGQLSNRITPISSIVNSGGRFKGEISKWGHHPLQTNDQMLRLDLSAHTSREDVQQTVAHELTHGIFGWTSQNYDARWARSMGFTGLDDHVAQHEMLVNAADMAGINLGDISINEAARLIHNPKELAMVSGNPGWAQWITRQGSVELLAEAGTKVIVRPDLAKRDMPQFTAEFLRFIKLPDVQRLLQTSAAAAPFALMAERLGSEPRTGADEMLVDNPDEF